jgi:hypothetical protein
MADMERNRLQTCRAEIDFLIGKISAPVAQILVCQLQRV